MSSSVWQAKPGGDPILTLDLISENYTLSTLTYKFLCVALWYCLVGKQEGWIRWKGMSSHQGGQDPLEFDWAQEFTNKYKYSWTL